jgi:hypothetical protein
MALDGIWPPGNTGYINTHTHLAGRIHSQASLYHVAMYLGDKSKRFLLQNVSDSVLPGPEAASPLIEQKNTAIWRKHTAISNLSKIPLLFRYFLSFLCTNFLLQEAIFP